jgi:tetratricopeptide (TPR) repeat protein
MAADGLGALLERAHQAFAAGRLDEARQRLEEAHSAAPGDFRPAYGLALVDLRQGRLALARRGLEAAVRRRPTDFAVWRNLGAALQGLGLWARAGAAYERALALQPHESETLFALAAARAALGQIDDAAALYRGLAESSPLRALTRLAILTPKAVTDTEVKLLEGLTAETDADTAALEFARGAVREARGDAAGAFAAFAAGAEAKRASMGAGRPEAVEAEHERSAAIVKATFTPAAVARLRPRTERAAPIFIVGMPRCGSSLVEQILASHPGVHGLGETGVLPALVEAGLPYRPDPSRAASADPYGPLASDYLGALRERGWRSGTRPLDKTLENHLHVGVIVAMFPRALVLHCRRDPVETCLSVWRQLFSVGAENLYDLAQIGRAYVRYRQVMDHWDLVQPCRVRTVDYEALTADPETAIRTLVTESCELAWDARCLRFHETRRAVATASAVQVRSPIAPVARRERYTRHLGPLLEALGAYAD